MDNTQKNKEELTAQLQKEIKKTYLNPYTKLFPTILNIKNLLAKGANINSTDENSNTLLHHIISSHTIKAYNAYVKENLQANPIEKTKYLLDLSTVLSSYLPNPFIKNKEGKTAFDLATDNRLKKEAKTLAAYENAYSSFVNEKQINFISYNQHPVFILNRKNISNLRQKD